MATLKNQNSRALTNTNYQQAFIAIVQDNDFNEKFFSANTLSYKKTKENPCNFSSFTLSSPHINRDRQTVTDYGSPTFTGSLKPVAPIAQAFKKTLDLQAVFLLKVTSNW
jgi:hypothetical protein